MSMEFTFRRCVIPLIFLTVAIVHFSCIILYTNNSDLKRDIGQHALIRHNNTWRWTLDTLHGLPLLNKTQDFDLLVDLAGFQFLLNNHRCDGHYSILLLVFVLSSPRNFERRLAIRDTWGKEDNIYNETIRVVFLLGSVPDHELQHLIIAENAQHHDLVQGNFVDSYRNLTYKHVMGLKWVTYFCLQSRFVLKTDDDVFVDIFQTVYFLKSNFDQRSVGNFMMCHLQTESGRRVIRSYRSKWRVSFKEYPEPLFPRYCLGAGILMSSDAVFKLYLESPHVPYFWLEDVYVTGLLAARVGITHVDFKEASSNASHLEQWLTTHKKTMWNFHIMIGDTDPDTIRTLWNMTVHHYNSSIPEWTVLVYN